MSSVLMEIIDGLAMRTQYATPTAKMMIGNIKSFFCIYSSIYSS